MLKVGANNSFKQVFQLVLMKIAVKMYFERKTIEEVIKLKQCSISLCLKHL